MVLYMTIGVISRLHADKLEAIHESLKLPFLLRIQGHGSVSSDYLSLRNMDPTEKSIFIAISDTAKCRELMRRARDEAYIDIPSRGVMMAVPVKSVGGRKTLEYLQSNLSPEGAAPKMQFEYELIYVILNHGYVDEVMDAARDAGAGGGTVLHAKGSGSKYASQFLGMSLSDDKDLILIVVKAEKKAGIMQRIAEETGITHPAGAICFSVPVSGLAGFRNMQADV